MLCHLFNQAIALSQQQSDPHMFGSFKGIILKKTKQKNPKTIFHVALMDEAHQRLK